MTDKYMLWLDDERPPPMSGKWVVIKNPHEFTTTIKERGMPDHISFDWWLGSGWDTGDKLIEWLIDQDQHGVITFPPDFTFSMHSSDFSKNRMMHTTLSKYLESRGIL